MNVGFFEVGKQAENSQIGASRKAQNNERGAFWHFEKFRCFKNLQLTTDITKLLDQWGPIFSEKNRRLGASKVFGFSLPTGSITKVFGIGVSEKF